jgi:hypothetical protein
MLPVLEAGITLIVCIIWAIASMIMRRNAKPKPSPIQARNLEREQQFLNNMLEDLKKNTSEWFAMDEVGQGKLIANDKKNIGIVYNGKGESATLLLNLESLTSFEKNNQNTVKLHLLGDHVEAFIKDAEEILDRRGHEISFFESELEKRL